MVFQVMRLQLLIESGPFGNLGALRQVLRLAAVGLPGLVRGTQARLDVLEPVDEQTWRKRSVELAMADVEALVTQLRALDFLARAPALTAVVDTGEGWERITLGVELDGVERTFSLQMQWSGFKGPDADRWRGLFAWLLWHAGVEHHHAWAHRG
jgi:hypothetical protein